MKIAFPDVVAKRIMELCDEIAQPLSSVAFDEIRVSKLLTEAQESDRPLWQNHIGR